jgi:hypothetical protein
VEDENALRVGGLRILDEAVVVTSVIELDQHALRIGQNVLE